MCEAGEKAESRPGRPGAEADAAHAQALQLCNGRRRRAGKDIQGTVDSVGELADGLGILNTRDEEGICPALAVSGETPDGMLEAAGRFAHLVEIDVRAGVDHHVHAERLSHLANTPHLLLVRLYGHKRARSVASAVLEIQSDGP